MIVRHDVNSECYLAERGQFSAVFAVSSWQEEVLIAYDKIDELLKPSLLPVVQPEPEFYTCCNGMGVLIAPNWVLSAAHVATELSTDSAIEIASTAHTIESVVLHPNFCDYSSNKNNACGNDFGSGDLGSDNFGDSHEVVMMAENDIALIQLKKSVREVSPLLLHKQKDELGQVVTLVGQGDYGNGLIGPDSVDGKLRMATNRVEATDDQWLVLKFDKPPAGTELEGIAGPGGSGGPALIKTDEGWAIAGIRSGQNSLNLGEGRYGVWEYYTRVSFQLDWIEAVLSA